MATMAALEGQIREREVRRVDRKRRGLIPTLERRRVTNTRPRSDGERRRVTSRAEESEADSGGVGRRSRKRVTVAGGGYQTDLALPSEPARLAVARRDDPEPLVTGRNCDGGRRRTWRAAMHSGDGGGLNKLVEPMRTRALLKIPVSATGLKESHSRLWRHNSVRLPIKHKGKEENFRGLAGGHGGRPPADNEDSGSGSDKLALRGLEQGVTESLSTAINIPVRDTYMSDFGSVEVNNSAITGVGNEPIGSYWDWDDDDRGMEMDIQALLSEFGDFGDFFENDLLPFGEPPGTAESQALMFSSPDYGDVNSSPGGVIDVPDQMLLPVGFPSFESFNPLLQHPEFDHIMKAEAMMTFAPEFGAVESPTCELSTTLFRSPYFPNCRKAESSNSSSNNYSYGSAPPSSPCNEGSEGKNGMSVNTKTGSGKHDSSTSLLSKHYYTFVESRKEKNDKNPVICNDNSIAKSEGILPLSNIGSNAIVKSSLRKTAEGTHEPEHVLLSAKTLLATDITCVMLQASVCRLRHILLSSGNLMTIGFSRSTGVSFLNQFPSDPNTATDNISGKYDVKKKENIPIRIAGDIDGGMLDGHLNAPVGVWRTLGSSKVVKPSNSPNMEVGPSFSHSSFNAEDILSYGQRKPLQELLDGIALLVQQALSFVDQALDTDCGDGPYGLLCKNSGGVDSVVALPLFMLAVGELLPLLIRWTLLAWS
ncbi:hypothetical protein V8G54_007462 [Vigna mungo]|uniref:Mediator of RNA polymerase II transcription subunit 13 n=1 Tax=Vigna mungo TaxID=3915 RepID=A0AAQ3P3C3_VIGMU